MKVTATTMLIMVLVCTVQCIQAQSAVEVSKPELSLKDKKVQIGYDILNSSRSDKFTISLEVTNESGDLIEASSLSGDIGEHIEGGRNKLILWDIEVDSIFLDEEIFVQISALNEAPPVTEEPITKQPDVIVDEPVTIEQVAVEDQSITKQPDAETEEHTTPDPDPLKEESEAETKTAVTETGSDTRSFSRTGIIAQSLVLPGLGLSRVNPGKPHWIKGVLGYGCIAGSLYLNKQAVSSYDAYRNPTTPDDVDNLFNQARRQDVTSEVLAFAAIGIWVTDLVWTIVGTSDLGTGQLSENEKGFSIGPAVEPLSSVPLIAFRYKF